MTEKIVPLRRDKPALDAWDCELSDIGLGARAIQQSAFLMASGVANAIAALESKLDEIRQQIASISDPEVSRRLTQDYETLMAALDLARAKATLIIGSPSGE